MSAALVRLGEVAQFINGAAFKPEDWGDEGRKIIRIQNLTDPSKPYNKTLRQVDSKLVVERGDLLVSWSATLGVFEWLDDDALLNQHIFRVIPDVQKVDKNYLKHSLKNAIVGMDKHLHGATMKHINRGEFLATKIPLPPISEQKRIAAILDKATEIKAKRELVLAKLDALAHSTFIEMFGGDSSKKRRLDELGSVKTGGTPSSSKEGMFGDEIPFVTPGDLESNASAKRYLSKAGASDSVLVKKGSALVCCIGATIGKMDVAYVTSAFNQQINAVEWNDEIDSEYGIFALKNIKHEIIKNASSTTLPILKKSLFQKLQIKAPSIEKQKEFAEKIKLLKNQHGLSKQSLAVQNSLIASLQHKAFTTGFNA